ncbi:MAG: polysaccharide deacetylase family protein [Cyanosarcina radialis HA8281-LM2]|nr:polysaccharide deacetylase family protein [Cyanosarcina radialis HA8281-LM2]
MAKRYLFVKDKKHLFAKNQRRLNPIAIASGIFALGAVGASWVLSKNLWLTAPKSTTPEATAIEALPDRKITQVLAKWEQEARTDLFTFAVPARFQGQTLKEIQLPSQRKLIALTFDDGPWPVTTGKILAILKKNNIKATFFMVGQPLQNYPQIAQQVVAEGHALGNHTWHHWYHAHSPATAASEIEKTAALLHKTTGFRTYLFRPPGGVLNNGLAHQAKKQKYLVAMWSADSKDYSRPSVPTLVRNVLKDAKPGGMLLLHDGGGDRSHTVQALPQIIADLRSQGYQFVTVPELLEIADKELKASKLPKPPTPK